MTRRQLEIGSVKVPLHATATLEQRYETLGARTTVRMADGSAALRESWSGKLATDITGSGPIPPGLTTLDYSSALTVKCVAPRAITATSNKFSGVTASRRSDAGATAYGRATADGQNWQAVTVTWGTSGVKVNEATLGTISGATAYQLVYYPSISCFVSPPTEEWGWDGEASWSMRAEEA